MGDKIVSNKGRFTVIMQTDCNLVLYDSAKGKGGYDPSASTWASGTWVDGTPSCYAEVESNGTLSVFRSNAIVYKTPQAAVSSSLAPLFFVIQDDGNFVAYQCTAPYWASNTWTSGAGFLQIAPSLNPNFVPSAFLVDGFNRRCFGDDEAACADAMNDEIGFIAF